VLVATNTLVGSAVGVSQFVLRTVLVLYGGGLGISYVTG
jgi:hypothetical protein